MDFKLNDSIKNLEVKRAREIIYFITKTRTQHIGLVPTFEQLTDHYQRTNRKAIRLFLKIDSKILQRVKHFVRKIL
ncbi:MAG: hypothetical protein KatS3mg085_054 [Candidatus Dojkabacteria bacterium]|nr:MAG: hypothetical protein KatS3mg085_054 [Candidatus Dojkabacteria bacterium]